MQLHSQCQSLCVCTYHNVQYSTPTEFCVLACAWNILARRKGLLRSSVLFQNSSSEIGTFKVCSTVILACCFFIHYHLLHINSSNHSIFLVLVCLQYYRLISDTGIFIFFILSLTSRKKRHHDASALALWNASFSILNNNCLIIFNILVFRRFFDI